MKKIVTLIIAFVATTISFAQDDAYIEDAIKCINSNGTHAYYENVVDQMFINLENKYASHNIPNTVWDELKMLKEESLEELSLMIVTAYQGHFTHEDVKNMNALYSTKAGQNMFKSESELTEDEKAELDEFYLSDTGQKITDSQDSMNDAMSKISEMWSRAFYKSVVNKLKEKGFSL